MIDEEERALAIKECQELWKYLAMTGMSPKSKAVKILTKVTSLEVSQIIFLINPYQN